MLILTLPHLIKSAQDAICTQRLGLQNGYIEPRFVYDDGSVCAIGAALPDNLLHDIRRNGDDRLNWLELKRAGYFEPDALDTIEMLTTLQIGYDCCCVADGVKRSRRAAKFYRYVVGLSASA